MLIMGEALFGLVGDETNFLALSFLLVSTDMCMLYALVCLFFFFMFKHNLTKLILMEEVIKQFNIIEGIECNEMQLTRHLSYLIL